MPVGASVFCLVAGAILTFAIETDSTEGINVNNIGVILMVVGAIGLVASLAVWGPRSRRYVAEAPVVERRVVVDEPVVEERVVRSRPVVERRVYGP